jgi:signal transduction histidine kinase
MRADQGERIAVAIARLIARREGGRAAPAFLSAFGADGVALLVEDPAGGGRLVATELSGRLGCLPPEGLASDGGHVAATVFRSGKGAIRGLGPGRSAAAIPLRLPAGGSGVILMERGSPWTPGEVSLAEALGGVSSLAVERREGERLLRDVRNDLDRASRELTTDRRERSREIRLTRQDLEIRVKRLSILYQVARTLSTTMDLTTVMEGIVLQAARHLGAAKASVMLVRAGSDEMVINAAIGLKEWVMKRTRLRIGDGIAGRVAAEGKPVLVKEIESDNRFTRRKKSTYRTGSLISVPMIMAGRVLGVMNVADKRGGGSFTEDDLDLLTALADQAAVAVHQAALFGEVRQGRDTLAELYGRLEAEQSKTFLVLAGIADGVVAIGTEGEILTANPAAGSVLGIPPDELLGGTIGGFAARSSMAGMIAGHHRRALKGEVISEVLPVELREEVSLYMEIRTSPLKAVGFPLMGTVTVIHDVTELKKIDDMRTEFISRASHELRTPVGIVKGFLQTLVSHPNIDRERGLRFIERSLAETDRLAELTENLLDLSRLESGRKALELVPVDLHETAASVVGEARTRAGEKRLKIAARRGTTEAIALADPLAIRQVAVNLVSNALKFTPEGGRIEVLTAVRGGRAEFSVKDTGMGIPEEHLPRIFEKFYRGAAEQTGIPGTGLGLAIVKELVEAMKGGISIKSGTSGGTKVEVWLPAADNEEKR